MDFLRAGPALESYIPLSEHQSSTPSSFFIGPPVLYYHCKSATLSARSSDLPKSDAVKQFCDHARTRYTINEGALDGSEEEIAIKDVEIVVASHSLTFSAPSIDQQGCMLKVSYPSISLHAIQHAAAPDQQASLYLQLTIDDGGFDDHDTACVSLSIVPTLFAESSSTTAAAPINGSSEMDPVNGILDDSLPVEESRSRSQPPLSDESPLSESPTTSLFNALSACANLHPDPPGAMDDLDTTPVLSGNGVPPFQILGDSNGDASDEATAHGLPPALPGSGGWITAENLHEHFDDEGNWLPGHGPQQEREAEKNGHEYGEEGAEEERDRGLGPGAGSMRTRTEDEADGAREGDNNEGGSSTAEETKWRRTG